jgi:hypothetical protein
MVKGVGNLPPSLQDDQIKVVTDGEQQQLPTDQLKPKSEIVTDGSATGVESESGRIGTSFEITPTTTHCRQQAQRQIMASKSISTKVKLKAARQDHRDHSWSHNLYLNPT